MTGEAVSPLSISSGRSTTADDTLVWILRLGLAACFIGHGALGFYHQKAWTAYFGVVGIGPDTAYSLMPWVGVFDIALALSVLIAPVRWIIVYMVAWTVWTALLRPLSGESFWEAIERAGNYGVPLALWLYLAPGVSVAAAKRSAILSWTLRLTTVLLLLGHGALGLLVQKPLFAKHYVSVGLPGASLVPVVGAAECGLALAVLFWPNRWLLVAVFGWKLATEVLSPIAGSPVWVFIEHGGSYAAPLALIWLATRNAHSAAPLTA
ncbi:MAG TPA: hypothetical protein VHD32_18310 [Candidatus Didemnitutus sp.]|nr:hypothetical protein [Candidatus Didemnitutus sp.]